MATARNQTAKGNKSDKPAQRAIDNGTHVATVAQAKTTLPSLLRRVEEDHLEITVLRRDRPVARIVPIEGSPAPVTGFGWLRGSVEELGDIVGPTGESWDAGDENIA